MGLVMNIARTSMIHAHVPHFLWPYAVCCATHQLNLSPRVSRPGDSPTSLWTSPLVLHRSCTSEAAFGISFDESVSYYTRYLCQGLPVPPPPLFLAPSPPPVPAPPGVLGMEVLVQGVLVLGVLELVVLALEVLELEVLELEVLELVILELEVLALEAASRLVQGAGEVGAEEAGAAAARPAGAAVVTAAIAAAAAAATAAAAAPFAVDVPTHEWPSGPWSSLFYSCLHTLSCLRTSFSNSECITCCFLFSLVPISSHCPALPHPSLSPACSSLVFL
ncbi:unnamed protein product [Closterium sp. NIES-65]|nr:unnamed protein product [Closterium sp. NIES-65]